MPRDGLLLLLVSLLLVARAPVAQATASSNFWAPSTPYVQPFKVLHVTYDTYFGAQGSYPTDAGLTMGVLPGQKFQAELGFDLFYPTVVNGEGVAVPVVLNAKAGSPENALFDGQPAWSFGIYGAGFEEDINDQNILYFMLGKTFPRIGMPHLGVYYGLNENLFRTVEGDEERVGLLAGWNSPAIDVPYIDKIAFVWDIQTGETAVGATGVAMYAWFTPTVSLEMGPVFFFENDLQPGGDSWMWSIQLDADISLGSE